MSRLIERTLGRVLVLVLVLGLAAAPAHAQVPPVAPEDHPDAAPPEPAEAPPAEPTPLATPAPAPPSPPDDDQPEPAPHDPADQSVGAALGIATGGRVTPGGLRMTGHYLYQLSSQDWFDGTAAFTFGGGDAACFRDRMDLVVCEHGISDGAALELAAGVRRMFAAQGSFRPFARVAVGLSYVRFADDDVSGIAIPLHLGGGVRARVSSTVAIVGMGELTLGFGRFGRGLGVEPQAGIVVTAGAEFQLR